MRYLSSPLLSAALLCLLPHAATAQQNDAARRLTIAHATYYTPTASGLQSFHCNAAMDWKDLLTRFGGKEPPADSPLLNYLDTVHLAVADDLHGNGSLEWTAATQPPESIQPNVQQLRQGLEQMFSGFFQTWNAYMNGSMVPVPDATTAVSTAGDQVKLHGTAGSMILDELFDRNLLLTEAHVVQPTMDVTAYPTYLNTPDGRVISSVRSIVHEPPTAPALEITLATTYATVQNFRLPALLTFTVQNVGTFNLNLSGCTVKTAATQ